MGAGIAGVGIPAEIKGEGIMVIKERSKYREWEFIYDPKEDKNVVGAAAAAQNANGGAGAATNPLGPSTNPLGSGNSPFQNPPIMGTPPPGTPPTGNR